MERVVLAIQDTTALDDNGLEATRELVGLGGPGKGVKGLMGHSGLAVNLVGRPLGVFSLDADFRHGAQENEKESRRWLEGLERAGKLASACPKTRVITVCDREGDIWTLIREAVTTGAGLLVRANRARSCRVITANGSRRSAARRLPAPPRGAHKAKLDLRACTVTLAAPADATDKTATRMLAVSATETSPAHGREPLHWLLLTTEGEPSAEQARKVIAWYERRWSIETWFCVLKTGTRVEDRQFDDADVLRKCLVFDAITACHIHDLNITARTSPQSPADEVVEQDMIDCLYEYLHILGVPEPGNRPTSAPSPSILPKSQASTPAGNLETLGAWMHFRAALIYHRGLNQHGQLKGTPKLHRKYSESYVGR